tara:strand:+ start:309 stop:3251 length:2943 start_codon:yes stop_codon:yes gene_type:complete
MDNLIVDRAGAARKRDGYGFVHIQVYPSSPVEFIPGVADAIDSRRDELRIYGEHTDGLLWSWSWSESAQRWVRKDTVAQCSVETKQVATAYVSTYLPQVAITSTGKRALLWITAPTSGLAAGATCMLRIEDSDGGALQDDTVIATGAGVLVPYLLACGDLVVAVVWDTGTNVATAYVVSATGALTSSVVAIPALTTLSACELDATQYLLAYRSAANVITIDRVTAATGAVAATVNFASVADPFRVAIHAVSGVGIALATSDATGVNVWKRNSTTLAAVWGPTVLAGAAIVGLGFATSINASGKTATIWGDLTTDGFTSCGLTDSAGVATSMLARNTLPITAPFWIGDVCYAGAASLTTTPGGAHLVCWSRPILGDYPTLVATLSKQGTGSAPAFGQIPRAVVTDLVVTVPISGAVSTSDQAMFVATCDFTAGQTALLQPSEQRDCLAHSGGLTGWFDGISEVEVGFADQPSPSAPGIVAAVAPGAIAAGTYLYGFCWEWLDTVGNIHRSQVYTETVTTVAASSSVTFDVYCSILTRRGDSDAGEQRAMTLAAFRTTNNGTIPYRITPPKAGFVAAIANDKTQFTVPFVDTTTDAALTALGYGVVYTFGDIVESVLPPASRAIVSHRNRLWIASGEDTRELWFSKLIVASEGPGFSPLLTLRVDDANDGVTALGSMDDKLIVFTRDRIYYASGDGPNDTALGGAFQGPFRITTDFGCADQRSVVTYPDGVLFWNGSGIYKLDRALQVSLVGDPVIDTTTGATAVIARLDPIGSRVWFLVTDEFGASSFCVFDYRLNIWTTATIYGVTDGGAAPIKPKAHHWHNREHWIGQESTQDGILVSLRGVSPGYDGETWFPATLETPWVHVAGINGFQRVRNVWFTGQRVSNCVLGIDLYTNYDETTTNQHADIDLDVTSQMLGLPVVRLGMHVRSQLSSAIKMRLYDSEPADPVLGQLTGWDITGISMEIGVKGGYKSPALNKAGG